MFTIRPMEQSDIAKVIDIYSQALEKGRSTFNTICPTAQEWDNNHLKKCRLVVCENDNVIGWVALAPTSARECYSGVCEVSLYIDNNYQSKGVGTLLMQELVKVSEENDVWQLYAAIFSINKASINMCLKNGWRIVGTRERIAKDRFGNWQDTTIMERRSKKVGID